MAILSCHVSIKLPPKISDGQGKENPTVGVLKVGGIFVHKRDRRPC